MTPPQQVQPNDGKIEMAQPCQLSTPEIWNGFPVQDKDWERIVKITEKIIPPASIWQIIWPASFGIAASAFVSTFTIIEKDHPNKTICYGIALVFLILGIFGLIIDITQRKI